MLSRHRAALGACAGLLVLPSTIAHAQEGDANAPDEFIARDQIVVTASRARLPARQVGSAVTVITREDLERNQVRQVKEILQDVPGVQINTARQGAFTNVAIRGSDNDQVLVLIDGIELGDPSSTSTQYQFNHLTSLDIERIEVLRGNQSSLYGSDAIGGVINIITRRAEQEGLVVNAEAEGGSFRTANGGVSVLGRQDIVDFRVTAFGYHLGGQSLADPATSATPVADDEYNQVGLSGRLGFQILSNLSLEFTGFLTDTYLELGDFPDDDADADDSVDKDERAGAARLTWDIFKGRWRHEATASIYNAKRTFTGAPFNLPEGDVYDGTKTNLTYVTTVAPIDPITLVAGVDLEDEETEQLTGFSGDFDASIETRSVFGELAVEPIDGLTFTGAARLDDNSRFGTFDTYRVTAAYFINPIADVDVKLRGSYGTGAKAPGLYQLFDPTYGNEDLEVEESTGWDVGFDVYWDTPQLSFEFTYFDNDVENEIDFDFAQGGYIQRGSTKSQGVEIGLAAQPLDWLQVRQTYTYLDAQDRDTDLWLGRPRHSGTTSATVFPTEQTSLTARARYRTQNASSFGGVTNDFVVFDVLGSYQVLPQVNLYARLENVADADYQTQFGRQTNGLSAFGGLRLSFATDNHLN